MYHQQKVPIGMSIVIFFFRCRCEPTTVEEEAQLELALQASFFYVGLQKRQPEQSNKEQSPREPIPNLNENDAANELVSLSNPTIAQ